MTFEAFKASLCERMAQAIYEDGCRINPWDKITPDRRHGFRLDALRAMAVMFEHLGNVTPEMADAAVRAENECLPGDLCLADIYLAMLAAVRRKVGK